MNETLPIPETMPKTMSATMPGTTAATATATTLAGALEQSAAASGIVESRDAGSATTFADNAGIANLLRELHAVTAGAGVFDLGSRVRIRITGADRVRWLNGMVTNTVKALAAGTHNYSFVLNAQGRIQGDATIFAFPDHLLLETDRAQSDRLRAHLDRFIIMDEVELAAARAADESETTLGLAGPDAAAMLAALALPVPEMGTFATDGELTVVAEHTARTPRYSLWVAAAGVPALWQRLLGAGAIPVGALAHEAFRIGEGLPLYGADMTDRTLPQETGQAHALNFNKGCYLGQEIVERIRSQAKVHRGIRLFRLQGEAAVEGTPLTAEGAPAGELTSVSQPLPGGLQLALATIRLDQFDARATLDYPGGLAMATSIPIAWDTLLPLPAA